MAISSPDNSSYSFDKEEVYFAAPRANAISFLRYNDATSAQTMSKTQSGQNILITSNHKNKLVGQCFSSLASPHKSSAQSR